ncbi:MAG: YCF48-related protein, partial [bacterium]|nr:YCF48-related protein [bacterium]
MKGLRGVVLTVLLLTGAAIQAQTWELQFGAPRHDDLYVRMTDITAVGSQVWAVGQGIWYSADAGQTWSVQMDSYYRYWYVVFRDSLDGWAVGEHGRIAHTENGGQTWNSWAINTETTLEAIAFKSDGRGWVVGKRSRMDYMSDSAYVALTTDGGTSWSPMDLHYPSSYYGIVFADEYHGFIYGGAQSLETTDGGETWIEGDFPEASYIATFVNATLGWATGGSYYIYRTTDGGETWEGSPVNGRFYDLWFLNESYGWVVGRDGRVVATMDGGENWQLGYSGTSQTLRGVVFSDPTHGLVGGEGGVLRVTENGGQSWRNLFGNEEGWPILQAVAFDELGFNGWVV